MQLRSFNSVFLFLPKKKGKKINWGNTKGFGLGFMGWILSTTVLAQILVSITAHIRLESSWPFPVTFPNSVTGVGDSILSPSRSARFNSFKFWEGYTRPSQGTLFILTFNNIVDLLLWKFRVPYFMLTVYNFNDGGRIRSQKYSSTIVFVCLYFNFRLDMDEPPQLVKVKEEPSSLEMRCLRNRSYSSGSCLMCSRWTTWEIWFYGTIMTTVDLRCVIKIYFPMSYLPTSPVLEASTGLNKCWEFMDSNKRVCFTFW